MQRHIFVIFFVSILSLITATSATAAEIWVNTHEGFGALFPNPPKHLEATTSLGRGGSYQSVVILPKGGILYSITTAPTPTSSTNTDEKVFLTAIHNRFVHAMGGKPIKTSWTKFGGRIKLNYAFIFNDDGVPFTNNGFWIIDNGRSIRVSVSYTHGLSDRDVMSAVKFLDTFILVHKK